MVDYSDLEDIKHMPDSLAKYIPHKIMRNNPAHIGIFAVDHEKKLRIVAIQQGTTQGITLCLSNNSKSISFLPFKIFKLARQAEIFVQSPAPLVLNGYNLPF